MELDERQEHDHSALATVSQGIVMLYKEYYGRGPTKAKSYFADDVVVVLLRGGFTKAEETLLRAGRGDSVIHQRMDFQDVMKDRFVAVVEEALGRKVAAMMSGSNQEPDLLSEVFVLQPAMADLHENPHAGDPS